MHLSASVFIAALVAAATASAQDIRAGKDIAQATCGGCHIVDPKGQKTGSDAVPTFAAIARMPSTTAASLTVFLSSPHSPMPDLVLSRQEIRDLVAYILSLRGTL
jgi:cytochrome c